jgi:hypothetical protein
VILLKYFLSIISSNKDGLRWAWLEFETLKAYIKKECEENTWYGLGPINTCTKIISFNCIDFFKPLLLITKKTISFSFPFAEEGSDFSTKI